jgi:hypothetical protein
MRLEQMRRDFVANVSHELRTPLTVVHGYLDMLDPTEQPEWAPMLAEMQRQSQRMTQLVEDLLTLSRLEAQDALAEETSRWRRCWARSGARPRALSQNRHAITPGGHRAGRPLGLDQGAPQRVLQPGQQRGALYAGRWQHRDCVCPRR